MALTASLLNKNGVQPNTLNLYRLTGWTIAPDWSMVHFPIENGGYWDVHGT